MKPKRKWQRISLAPIGGRKGGKEMEREKKVVAYKTWRCKFCFECKESASDMAKHLQKDHYIGLCGNDGQEMVSLDKEGIRQCLCS